MKPYLGIDVGSSSVKVSLVDCECGRRVASAQSPETEMEIDTPFPGFAEQAPEMWWKHLTLACHKLALQAPDVFSGIAGIGIAYQMHGLVLVDKHLEVLRPAIIWCDSRAIDIGREAFALLGGSASLPRLMNAPGNFTASKLKWVMRNEPAVAERIAKFMLPGDYIALRLTGRIGTTSPGLSEGVLWDAERRTVADEILDLFGIREEWVPDVVPVFGVQGLTTRQAAQETGLRTGTPVAYRAGDQPNNALSLNVFNAGEAAVTAGTSGVIYTISNTLPDNKAQSFNTFLHVNDSPGQPHYGNLLCLNGCGIMYAWLKRITRSKSYPAIDRLAETAGPGSDGLKILPFGNGAERMLGNKQPGASVSGVDFNRHTQAHLFRAAQEAIAFSFLHGRKLLEASGLPRIRSFRAGHANLFKSRLFCATFATLNDSSLDICDTDGAQGAAQGAALGLAGAGQILGLAREPSSVARFEPDPRLAAPLTDTYNRWETLLKEVLH